MKPMPDSCVFIDSNVMVYAYSGTEKIKQQVSRQLIKEDLQHKQIIEKTLTIINPYR
jgi:predicted nucleic acid-binding protein